MERFLGTWIVSALAIAFSAWLLGSKLEIGGDDDTTTGRVIAVLVVSLVFTIISMFVAPVVKTLSLPFIIVTLGFALLIINALLLLLTEWITGKVGIPLMIDGFWWAVLAAVVISISQTVISALLPVKR